MKTAFILSSGLMIVSMFSSCEKCKDCKYVEEVDGKIVNEIPYDQQLCGDEYRALENKTYTVAGGKGYNVCE